ncbi:phospholipase C-like protein [Leptotrombidium deliense]|uniref:Phospholipase C-like protein n=1 Tax=Leptotrombidium deliense TaxID=299467 RepID=A0A443SJ68_9ACAR|nr:phospholipase C-like protein [Leptotrombidium deliense]
MDEKRKKIGILKKRKDLIEENCFSLVFENKTTLDLIAPNKETCDLWVKGLNALLANKNFTKREEQFEAWLREQFNSADVNKNGSLSFAECQALLKKLNICITRRQARILFDAADFRKDKKSKNEEDALDEDEFLQFFVNVSSRPDIEEIFKR